ncbi:MAG TPA: site-specific recombinase [Streptosporangiaceae bacterium]|nr:site-specific recombinase [Streptosporangiaceae bacterium]
MNALAVANVAPVEYAVAVDRYLTEAELSAGSRRVYRISLASWAWPLVGKQRPSGVDRRRAIPPVVPLAVLDQDDAGRLLADAVASRLRQAEVRTVHRELSALRSAIGWWRRQEWIAADPTIALAGAGGRLTGVRVLTEADVAVLFRSRASLREQALWHLLRDSGAAAETVLRLDAGGVDVRGRRARTASGAPIEWSARTSDLLGWLLAGRRHGPLFLTDRRAPAGTADADVCPLSGRGRMSYRRAAEIFTEHTRQLDTTGRGWMLHQLRRSAP